MPETAPAMLRPKVPVLALEENIKTKVNLDSKKEIRQPGDKEISLTQSLNLNFSQLPKILSQNFGHCLNQKIGIAFGKGHRGANFDHIVVWAVGAH